MGRGGLAGLEDYKANLPGRDHWPIKATSQGEPLPPGAGLPATS